MRHPKISDWADFVRAVAGQGDRTTLQRHLEAGCDDCQAVVASLERVMTTAEIDGAVTPPDGAVRSVKAFFDLQRPQAESRWAELTMRQAFDSALTPMVASRASSLASRRMLFESDDYTLELSVDYTPGEVDAVLRGQIMESQGEPRSHTPVFLVGDGEVIGRAISAQHGTFELSSRLDSTCELWVFPDDDNRIRLSLKHEH